MICWSEIRVLESSRLTLRKVKREDTDAYYHNLGSSEAVTRYMLFDPHRDYSESVASIEKVLRRYDEGHCYRWAVTEKGQGELIGIMELLRFNEADNSCSFAYMLAEKCWGKGYGTEILKTVFDFAFREMNIKRIRADHMADNPASGRCMEKAGMVKIGLETGKYIKHGISHDAVIYEINR